MEREHINTKKFELWAYIEETDSLIPYDHAIGEKFYLENLSQIDLSNSVFLGTGYIVHYNIYGDLETVSEKTYFYNRIN